jgi:hypothetical protein
VYDVVASNICTLQPIHNELPVTHFMYGVHMPSDGQIGEKPSIIWGKSTIMLQIDAYTKAMPNLALDISKAV